MAWFLENVTCAVGSAVQIAKGSALAEAVLANTPSGMAALCDVPFEGGVGAGQRPDIEDCAPRASQPVAALKNAVLAAFGNVANQRGSSQHRSLLIVERAASGGIAWIESPIRA
jgi:hypothetical protein